MGQRPMEALGLAEMQLTHVAIAVHDIEEAKIRLGSLGMSFATPFAVSIPTRYRGADTVAGLRAAFAPGNPIQVEVVQPTGGESTIATFLRERGEGVQHFGYLSDDVDALVARAKSIGVEIDWLIEDEHGPAIAFVSGDAMFGVSAEIIRRSPPVTLSQWLVT